MSTQLRRAARLWGLQTGFQNADKKDQKIATKTLERLLEAVSGIEIRTDADLEQAVKAAHLKRATSILPEVLILIRNQANLVPVTLPEEDWSDDLEIRLSFEAQTEREGKAEAPRNIKLTDFKKSALSDRRIVYAGKTYLRKTLVFPIEMKAGYHELELLKNGKKLAASWVFARPPKAVTEHEKEWGVFAPLYGLKSDSNLGMGDTSDLERMQDFVKAQGGAFFGTLPLLSAVNEGESADPSPYSPVSRLFWNEIYLDVEKLAKNSERAQAVIGSREFQEKAAKLRGQDLVDHKAVYQLKKQVLQILSEEFFAKEPKANGSNRESAESSTKFREFLKREPLAEKYAHFREKHDADGTTSNYHLYAQFKMDEALGQLAEKAKQKKTAGLYLDFPVGVSRSGFDAHLYQSSFIDSASAGAPPDLLFHGGQDWGFAPLHPVEIRKDGYAYIRQCLRANLQFASVLRLDHIMGFFRIYAVPKGFSPKEGGYIRYKADELFAILAIEGERAGTRVIGEDLGTVPDRVRELILENDLVRMWVYPFEADTSPSKAIKKIHSQTLACINTHDLIPFAGYLEARDTQIFHKLGLLEDDEAKKQEADRKKTVASWKKDLGAETPTELLSASLKHLAASDAEFVLVNIEDLWLETEPQNVPGTWKEAPNWKKKLKFSLTELERQPALLSPLKHLSEERP